jgi:hypothetical protein
MTSESAAATSGSKGTSDVEGTGGPSSMPRNARWHWHCQTGQPRRAARRLVRGWSERSNRPPAAAVDRRNPAGFLLIDRTGRFGPGPGSESRLMYTLTRTRVVTGTQGVRVTVAP